MSCASAIPPAASRGGNPSVKSTEKADLARAKPRQISAAGMRSGVIKPWQPCHTQAERESRRPLTPAEAEIARRFTAYEAALEYRDDYSPPAAPEKPFPARKPFSGALEVGMDESGTVREIADHDDSLVPPGDHADLENESARRESTYVRACRNRAGKLTSPEAKRKGMAHEAKLESDTAAILDLFSNAGIPMEYTNCDRQMYIVSLLRGEFKKLRSTRQCCLLPTVARRKRSRIVKDLELWLKRPENRYDQFMLFTGGVRVPVGPDGRWAIQIMSRALSKLNSRAFMRRRGCFFVLRSIEIGDMADELGNVICNKDGVALAHVHAHVLMHQPGWFPPEEQAALTRDITQCWNNLMASAETKAPFWGWSGSLENIRECVKYVCKTDALLALDAANLRRTHEMLFRLHRVQPLGGFKRERASRRARVLTVGSRFVAEKGAREKLVPWVHPDWNCSKRTRLKTEEQKRAENARLEARKRRKERIAAMHADNRFKAWLEGRDTLKERQAVWWEKPPCPAPETAGEPPEPMGQKRKTVVRNRIFARLAPAPYFGRTWEPAVMVWNYQPERKAEVLAEWHAQPWIRDAVEAVRDIVAKARQLEADELLAEMRQPSGKIGCPRLDRNCPPAAGPPGGGFDPLPGTFLDIELKKRRVLA